MAIKLVALDLDGTTLNSRGRLSEETKKTLEKAIEKKVNVVIATGRCFSAVPQEILDIKNIRYIITSNGAQIKDIMDNETIYSNCIDSLAIEGVEKLLKNCGHIDHMIEVFIDGEAFMDEGKFNAILEGAATHRHREYVISTRKPVPNILGFMIQNNNKIENINIFFEDMQDKEDMWPHLTTLENVTLTTSLDNNWEIGGATTSKARAIEELSKSLNIRREEILACGDSPNDRSMLMEAGIPVAVKNAKEIIKEVAVFISGSNDEDGVATAIKKYVL